ncbi:DUF1801 domain-containing protein [Oscillatoria amoena NRMC-F 0135]|nr:DUF1801 domain-containing protein [Oscillatoria amoena NRMC-F 0135]
MQSKATTVDEYLESLPADRREALEQVRKVMRKHLDPKIVEQMQYGMIGYAIPHSVYPAGYHCDPAQPLPFGGLASQKNHMSLYLCGIYSCDPGTNTEVDRFRKAWAKTGKKLDMGKACIRFKKVEDLALEVIADTLERTSADAYIKWYEANIKKTSTASAKRPAQAGKKSASKQSR